MAKDVMLTVLGAMSLRELGVADTFGRFEPFSDSELEVLATLERMAKRSRVVHLERGYKFMWWNGRDITYHQACEIERNAIEAIRNLAHERWNKKFKQLS